jgi:hypothetical protein
MPLEDISERGIGDALKGTQGKEWLTHFVLRLAVFLAGLVSALFHRMRLTAP